MEHKITKVQQYLRHFHYLSGAYNPGEMDQPTVEALAVYKQAYSLRNPEPVIDKELISVMSVKRCGVPDFLPQGSAAHFLESAFISTGCSYFGMTKLRYTLLSSSPDLDPEDCRNAIKRAFQTWSRFIPVDFEESTQNPHLRISFYSGSNGNGPRFDGPMRILATSYYPPPCYGTLAGNMYFDEDETWRVDGSAYDLESVALHEIGHLLGLAHSRAAESVMNPGYYGVRRSLTADDITGIQSLYGTRSNS